MSSSDLGCGGFYLRHGYIADELLFVPFSSVFRDASPDTERYARPLLQRARQKAHLSVSSSSSCTAATGTATTPVSGMGLLLGEMFSTITTDTTSTKSSPRRPQQEGEVKEASASSAALPLPFDSATVGNDIFALLCMQAQRQWRLVDHGTTGAELTPQIIIKYLLPTERAAQWGNTITNTALTAGAEENGSTTTTNKEADATTTADCSEDPMEIHHATCGVSAVSPSFVTITIADGEGIRQWLRVVSAWANHSGEPCIRADPSQDPLMPAKPPLVLSVFVKARELRVCHTDDVFRAQRVELKRLPVLPPFLAAKLNGQACSSSSSTEMVQTSSTQSPRDTNTQQLQGPTPLAWPPICLRHTKTDAVLLLPNPASSPEVTWATLVQQARCAWRVHKPTFVYHGKESGATVRFSITTAEHFLQLRRQLQAFGPISTVAAAASSASKIAAASLGIPLELHVLEDAPPEAIAADPLPGPIRLGPMLDLRPPYFLPLPTATYDRRLEARPEYETKAIRHANLSLEAIGILNRIDAYNSSGAEYVPTWGRTGHHRALSGAPQEPLLLLQGNASGTAPAAATSTRVAESSHRHPEANEARSLAAANRAKLQALLAAEQQQQHDADEKEAPKPSEAEANNGEAAKYDAVKVQRVVSTFERTTAPTSTTTTTTTINAAANPSSSLSREALVSPYRIPVSDSIEPLLGAAGAGTSAAPPSQAAHFDQLYNHSRHHNSAVHHPSHSQGLQTLLASQYPFGPKYTVPALAEAVAVGSSKASAPPPPVMGAGYVWDSAMAGRGGQLDGGGLTAGQRHLQRLAKISM